MLVSNSFPHGPVCSCALLPPSSNILNCKHSLKNFSPKGEQNNFVTKCYDVYTDKELVNVIQNVTLLFDFL